jgi:pilus assembly protein CpaE
VFASVELLIVGDSRETITPIVESLEGQQMLSPLPYVVPRGEVMLPQYMDPAPDAIVFYVDEDWRDPVWELIEQMPRPRPPLFIMTPDNDMELLRTAMRLGVRDVFTMPVDVDDFVSAVTHVVREDRIRRGEEASRLISLMNTKGGSGASLIAANVALAMANQAADKRRLLLVDFDFQFGGLPTYLNLVARDGLIKAMEFVDSLDLSSLQAYVQRHDSGLDLLAAAMRRSSCPRTSRPSAPASCWRPSTAPTTISWSICRTGSTPRSRSSCSART